MRTFKKFLGVMLCICAFVFILITEQMAKNTQPFFVLLVFILVFEAVLLFRGTKKDKEKRTTESAVIRAKEQPIAAAVRPSNTTGISVGRKSPNASIITKPTAGQRTYSGAARRGYSSMQIESDLRILSDSIKILETTLNIEVFDSRYALCMKKAQALLPACGTSPKAKQICEATLNSEHDLRLNALSRICSNGINSAMSLKTTTGRINRLSKLIHDLQSSKTFKSLDEYPKQIDNLKNLINSLQKPQCTADFVKVKFNNAAINDSISDIAELDQRARKGSDDAYAQHIVAYKNLNFGDIAICEGEPAPLCSTEKYFLKALSNQEVGNLNFPGYWTYEYDIDYYQTIKKLVENQYVSISNSVEDLSFFTVTQLKDILCELSLPVSGKKSELIQRLTKHGLSDDVLKRLNLYKERFILTPLGKKVLSSLPVRSITKNLELEDECLRLIFQQDFNGAYATICLWESGKKYPRGIGIDWEQERRKGLDKRQHMRYLYFWCVDISDDLSECWRNYAAEIKACIILGNMMGTTADKITYLILRVVPCQKDPDLLPIVQKLQFKLMDANQTATFCELTKDR